MLTLIFSFERYFKFHGNIPFLSNLQSSRTMSFSAPSAINVDHSTVKFDIDQEHSVVVENKNEHRISVDSVQLGNDVSSIGHEWQSLSCLTDSTEQSAPVNFDMSNRVRNSLKINFSKCNR